MPVLFQYATLGFPGLLRGGRDDDNEDLIRAAIIGNLNGLFIIGEAIQYLADVYQGKPWADQLPSIPVYEAMLKPISEYAKAKTIKDPELRAERMQKAIFRMVEITGYPLLATERWAKNFDKVLKGEVDNVGEGILRIFNYSDYQITGPQKRKTIKKFSGKKKSSDFYDEDFDLDLDFDEDFDLDLDLDNIFE